MPRRVRISSRSCQVLCPVREVEKVSLPMCSAPSLLVFHTKSSSILLFVSGTLNMHPVERPAKMAEYKLLASAARTTSSSHSSTSSLQSKY